MQAPAQAHQLGLAWMPGGFQIQELSDAAAAAAAAGLAPDLPTETPGVGNLAFFKPEDAQYFAKIRKRRLT